MSNPKSILAWHILPDDGCLRFPPHTRVEPGMTFRFPGTPVMCKQGFHASRRLLDALGYAHGSLICRVRLGGQIIHQKDKSVAQTREVLWMVDATWILWDFACWCAEEALLKEQKCGREPAKESWAAIQARRDWLDGAISDRELQVAHLAAYLAAESAASLATYPAAHLAANSAANSVANSAAESAAYLTAKSAAHSAARSATYSAQNKKLTEMIIAVPWEEK